MKNMRFDERGTDLLRFGHREAHIILNLFTHLGWFNALGKPADDRRKDIASMKCRTDRRAEIVLGIDLDHAIDRLLMIYVAEDAVIGADKIVVIGHNNNWPAR